MINLIADECIHCKARIYGLRESEFLVIPDGFVPRVTCFKCDIMRMEPPQPQERIIGEEEAPK